MNSLFLYIVFYLRLLHNHKTDMLSATLSPLINYNSPPVLRQMRKVDSWSENADNQLCLLNRKQNHCIPLESLADYYYQLGFPD